MSAKASRRLRSAVVVVLVLAAPYVAYRYTLHRMVEAKPDEIRKQGYLIAVFYASARTPCVSKTKKQISGGL